MKKLKNKQAIKASKIAKTENLKNKTIIVKNAEGEPDTEATILLQNKISYTPKVSVIIPVYNTEEYLRECLESVVNQTLKEIEIICVDDGSTDSSLEILKEYAAKDNRFTIITQKNLHAGVARNAGLTVAQGEYLSFLDSDDFFELNMLEEMYSQIHAESADIIIYNYDTYDNEMKIFKSSYLYSNKYTEASPFAPETFKDYLYFIAAPAPWNKIFKKSLIEENQIFFENLFSCNDITFVNTALSVAKKISLTNKSFVHYRVNSKSNISYQRENKCLCIIDAMVCLKRNLKRLGLYEIYKFVFERQFISRCIAESLRANTNLKKQFNEHLKKNSSTIFYQKYLKEITPKISVIIPVYNVERYLRECLDSVINQTLKNIEIICINDGSTDSSPEILQEYAAKDNRIIIINQFNQGLGISRNNGIKIAKGDYVGFVDSDDFVDLNYFESLFNCAQKYKSDICSCNGLIKFNNNYEKIFNFNIKGDVFSENDKKTQLAKKTSSACIKILKRNFINKYDFKFYEKKAFGEDNCFSIPAWFLAKNISIVSDVFYHYRQREGSIVHTKRTLKDLQLLDVYLTAQKKLKDTIIDKNKLKEAFNLLNERIKQDTIWFTEACDNNNVKQAFVKKLETFFPDAYKGVQSQLKRLLNNELIISLTSYPARINTVNQTIESLLNQTMKADKVILWLAPEQFPNKESDLPPQLLALKDKGLTIDWYHDIKSYKKLIPTLKKYPEAIIVTADDDNIYQLQWLEKLYASYQRYPNDIHCHRVTKFYYDNQGFHTILGGYDYYKSASYLNKLVGLGGVLYPPHCFYKDILKEELIKQLAPTNDDQWFWIQAMLNGVKIRVVQNPDIKAHYVEGTQESGLTNINDKGQCLFWKDFRKLIDYYPQAKNLMIKESKKHRITNSEQKTPYRRELMSWYTRKTGKYLNLNNPQTFNEKIQWLKLYDSTPIKTRLADKYLVRDWVKEKIGEEYLIPLLGVYDKFNDIDFDKLPNQFVIKCNHGSGWNIIVSDKSKLDLADAKEKLDRWMNENFAFKYGFELHYRNIQPKIVIEEYMDDGTGDLRDYKYTCFNGKPEFIWIDSDRHTKHKRNLYDLNWQQLPYKVNSNYDTFPSPEKPSCLEKMNMLATKLSEGFPYVRVDFYIINNRIYFGEMTFTSSSGTEDIKPLSFEQHLCKMFKLPKLAYNIDTGEYYKLPKKSRVLSYLQLPYYLLKYAYLKSKYKRVLFKSVLKQLRTTRVDVKNFGTAEVVQQYHQYSKAELRDVILKLNPNSDYIQKHIKKLAKMVAKKMSINNQEKTKKSLSFRIKRALGLTAGKKRYNQLMTALAQNQESLLREIRTLKQIVEHQSNEIKQLQKNLADEAYKKDTF